MVLAYQPWSCPCEATMHMSEPNSHMYACVLPHMHSVPALQRPLTCMHPQCPTILRLIMCCACMAADSVHDFCSSPAARSLKCGWDEEHNGITPGYGLVWWVAGCLTAAVRRDVQPL